jgi:carbon storage regulator
MLVLTRKLDQSIVLGDGIVVSVLSIEGSRVRLGVSAPSEVPIRRGELRPFSPSSEQSRLIPAPAAVEARACNMLTCQVS